MDNYGYKIIRGGFAKCASTWNQDFPFGDKCYKLYFVAGGGASVEVKGNWYELNAGSMYYINGYHLSKNRCSKEMDLYWLHIIPQSLYLNMIISKFNPFYHFEESSEVVDFIDFKKILPIFDVNKSKDRRTQQAVPVSTALYVNAMISMLFSYMLSNENMDNKSYYDIYNKLSPAINYIDNHFTENLSLNEMAKKTYLNPSYFLRLFKKTFNMTPGHYITVKRLNEGAYLLKNTDYTVEEISEQLGFCNQFYFSKVFKNYYHMPPSTYRMNTFCF